MTPDERKKVHNALSTWKGIKTESVGDGKNRAIVVKFVGFVDTDNKEETQNSETSVDNTEVAE